MGEWGDVLGTLDCRKALESGVEGIDLGQATRPSWRGPCTGRGQLPRMKRMAFVLFFSEINKTS